MGPAFGAGFDGVGPGWAFRFGLGLPEVGLADFRAGQPDF